ncbi:MAG TPA: glycosyltransferase family 4 protein [Ktedonobacterales bacterium]|nr:glycosyltransferase family 4 protein [Ktedonobacterales bacterium]
MRILYLCADFGIPILGFKGASVHVRELTDALTRLGHDVVILTPNLGGGNTTMARVELVPETALPAPISWPLRRIGRFWSRSKRLERELRELRYNATLRQAALRLTRSWQPDLLYERYALYGLAGRGLAHDLDVPYLLEVNAPLRLERQRARGVALDWLARWAERRAFRADRVLCVSQTMAEYVTARGARPERVLVQPNAVDVAKFDPHDRAVDVRARLGLSDEHLVIGFAGSLKPWHGVESLVDAFAQVHRRFPFARLLIVGDGPAREAVTRCVAERDIEGVVAFPGNVPHAEVPRYLAAMDVTAAPYLDAPEFYFSPLKVFEYMAAGRPVVAPRLGQIAQLIRDGETGLFYTPGAVDELADRLSTLADSADLRARLGASAAAEARERYTWEATARRIVALGERPTNTQG